MTEVFDERAGISCEEITPPAPRLYRLSDLLDDFAYDIQARHEAKASGIPLGPVSGFPILDDLIGGAFMPGLHVIHGSPGTGKTALALQIAATCGCPAIFVSCEVNPVEIMRRMAARVTRTPLTSFKNGEMALDTAMELARRAAAAAPLLALADGTRFFASPDWLQQSAAEAKGQERHFLIVVDSLHTWAKQMPRGERGLSEYDEINKALYLLEQLAGALKAPVLVIAERSRGSMEKGGMSAGKGSSRIEYAGETVIGMDTDMIEIENRRGRKVPVPAPPDGNGEREIDCCIEKNRHGEAGKPFYLLFHGALQRFREA